MTAQKMIDNIVHAIQTQVLGKKDAVELAVCTFLSGGHLLIEDVPGVGKTTLAKAMAKALGGNFSRIQFTSDMLPSDIIGISVWNRDNQQFEFKPGPIFANIVLADEINRASPKTQSALLEAMSESQISQEGISHALNQPFMVIATQNIAESFGTYPLPESQMDRFAMRIQLGYTSIEIEKQIITGMRPEPPPANAVIDTRELETLQDIIQRTHVENSILDYVMAIIEKTRQSDHLALGAGPRGGIALHNCAKALAQLKGRDFVIVDDIKKLAIPVLAHRLLLKNDTGFLENNKQSVEKLLLKIIHTIPVPI